MKITQQTQIQKLELIQSSEVQTLNLAQNRNAGGAKIPNANRFSAPTYSNKAKAPAANSPLGRLNKPATGGNKAATGRTLKPTTGTVKREKRFKNKATRFGIGRKRNGEVVKQTLPNTRRRVQSTQTPLGGKFRKSRVNAIMRPYEEGQKRRAAEKRKNNKAAGGNK